MRALVGSHWGKLIVQYPKLSLILGGAASGKSNFAEKLVIQTKLPRSYLATAQALDDDMYKKIQLHQRDRGPGWATTEAPIELPDAVLEQPENNVILIDCLTLWLTNLMLADRDCDKAAQALFSAIKSRNAPVITVSNEIGHSVIPATSLGRRFQRLQGRLNMRAAAEADLAIMIIAGLPQILKGKLPGHVQ